VTASVRGPSGGGGGAGSTPLPFKSATVYDVYSQTPASSGHYPIHLQKIKVNGVDSISRNIAPRQAVGKQEWKQSLTHRQTDRQTYR